jgi:hypothetical protein
MPRYIWVVDEIRDMMAFSFSSSVVLVPCGAVASNNVDIIARALDGARVQKGHPVFD